MQHTTTIDLESTLTQLGNSPQDNGTLEMIVRRPENLQREVVETAELDTKAGLVGDNWSTRGSRHTEDGNADPLRQITMMNSRVLQAIAPDKANWELAGDQLYVDLDLSEENLPPGQHLAIGSVILEITSVPHNGCGKFTERFGHDAIRFVNSKVGRQNRRRGIYARIVKSGVVQIGDTISKIPPPQLD